MKLQKATVSVTVNDNNLTENRKQQLIDTVSKAANIAPEDIVITSFRQTEVQPETVQPEKKRPNRRVLFGTGIHSFLQEPGCSSFCC